MCCGLCGHNEYRQMQTDSQCYLNFSQGKTNTHRRHTEEKNKKKQQPYQGKKKEQIHKKNERCCIRSLSRCWLLLFFSFHFHRFVNACFTLYSFYDINFVVNINFNLIFIASFLFSKTQTQNELLIHLASQFVSSSSFRVVKFHAFFLFHHSTLFAECSFLL